MTTQQLTINPEEVHALNQAPASQPAWLDEVIAYVQRAAAEGEQVTLTARPRLLTPAQVAERTGMSRSTISRKIAAGDIRAIKVGNRNRIPYDEYLQFWKMTMVDIVDLTAQDIQADLFGDD
ncbi:excisionase family DNA-binding protein [Leucobacter sp. cx-42]|uniref:excisionase family DNA-binding protein n=1 Tax=unclassified Leucobacter TaxID=2621730 RepID=UPI00165E16C5|nr:MULTISPECIES: excisionase family DNA-binding protein [unclassified Leucobacter]MBC9955146.1 excisionase family DNA-binding protein [Leucobacter sp. cx-42]